MENLDPTEIEEELRNHSEEFKQEIKQVFGSQSISYHGMYSYVCIVNVIFIILDLKETLKETDKCGVMTKATPKHSTLYI